MSDLKAYGFYSTTQPQAESEIVWDWPEEPEVQEKQGPQKRGPKPTPGITTGMYFDYCRGLSIEEVAKLWGYASVTPIQKRFRDMGLPLRARVTVCECRGRNAYDVRGVDFQDANRERQRRAVAARLPVWKAALQLDLHPRWREVLELRINHPELSISELGELFDPPMSKHAVAAVLRRASELVAA